MRKKRREVAKMPLHECVGTVPYKITFLILTLSWYFVSGDAWQHARQVASSTNILKLCFCVSWPEYLCLCPPGSRIGAAHRTPSLNSMGYVDASWLTPLSQSLFKLITEFRRTVDWYIYCKGNFFFFFNRCSLFTLKRPKNPKQLVVFHSENDRTIEYPELEGSFTPTQESSTPAPSSSQDRPKICMWERAIQDAVFSWMFMSNRILLACPVLW